MTAGHQLPPRKAGPERPALRLTALVTAVTLLALAALAVATWHLRWPALLSAETAGIVTLVVAATLAEAFPVPILGVAAGGISLAAVFIVGSAALFGIAPAVLAGLVARAAIEIQQRRPPIRLLYNSAVYALSGLAAGLAAEPFGRSIGAEAAAVAAATAGFYVTNIVLVAAVIACAQREPFHATLRSSVHGTATAFAIMASVALTLETLWHRSPILIAALAGPIAAVALYQRGTQRELEALRLARTDPMTGLGNYRDFQDSLAAACEGARAGALFALCMIDLDDLKALNDRHGHPAGDRVLAEIGSQLRKAGPAFRLGGDEFALLLTARDEGTAVAAAERLSQRIAAITFGHGGTASISCGLAVPREGRAERAALIDMADAALYWAKAQGKGRVCAYGHGLAELAESARRGFAADREGQLRAAEMLAHAVDAREAATGAHSQHVGDLAGRLSARLGLTAEEADLIRLAGSLHDLGKLVLPEALLRKPEDLTVEERRVLESHPTIACRLLDSIGLEHIARWVLHHHERWDGAGYPDGLAGDAIPLPSRILFVADAYEAMTRARPYRAARVPQDALAELIRCAGSQFDPGVVSALLDELASRGDLADASAGGPGLRLVV